MAEAALRSLKIKNGSVCRLHKELKLYEEQVVTETGRTEAMRASGNCAGRLKQQENVLAESAMMVPDVRLRLENALGDLMTAVGELERLDGVAESAELSMARATVAEVKPLFE